MFYHAFDARVWQSSVTESLVWWQPMLYGYRGLTCFLTMGISASYFPEPQDTGQWC